MYFMWILKLSMFKKWSVSVSIAVQTTELFKHQEYSKEYRSPSKPTGLSLQFISALQIGQ